MPKYTWSANTREQWRFWAGFDELLTVCQNHDGPIVNKEWLDEELLAVGQIEMSGWFLELMRSGEQYANPNHSSLAYFLGITPEAPTQFPVGLRVDRGRTSPPDIDLDFDDRRRHEVIQYARDKYGENRVAHIGTFSRIKAKSAIKDVARVLGYDFAVGNDINKKIPPPVLGVDPTLTEALQKSGDLRRAYENDTDTKKIIDLALGIEGVYRQTGIHAAGVVISKSDVTDFVPIMRSYKDGEPGPTVTQWDMHRVEQCGQLKVDFLGLANLGTIDLCVETIKQRRGIEIDVDNIEPDDPLTFEKMREGLSMGTFQLESPGMQQMMVALQPNSIEDVMALISLYRPGPLGSGMDKMFIAGKHGGKNKADHPLMQELLESTYGFMLYQEDVLSVSRTLAGFSAAEADDLRKAIGKKLMDKIGLFREKFVEGCKKTNNIDEKIANKIYSDIEYFGGYGFNLAHCITGDTEVALWSGGTITVEELNTYRDKDHLPPPIIGFDREHGLIFPDWCVNVIDEGEQDIYEVEFEDGSTVSATLNHKFLCSHDMQYHELSEIIEKEFDVVTI